MTRGKLGLVGCFTCNTLTTKRKKSERSLILVNNQEIPRLISSNDFTDDYSEGQTFSRSTDTAAKSCSGNNFLRMKHLVAEIRQRQSAAYDAEPRS